MMGIQLYWVYAFNVVVNSILSFFTMIFLVELFILLFRIKHPRMKVICWVLPFFKICLDLCLYRFSNWALSHGDNPLLAEIGSRQLSIILNPFTGIQLSMQNGKTFSVADIIALSMDPFWIQIIVSLAAIGSMLVSALYLIRIFREKQRVSWIMQGNSPILLQNLHTSLAAWMKKKQVSLAVSTRVNSSGIAGKTILFPTSLIDDLSQDELEAIIAHEIAHCHWKDCGLRLVCLFVASIFWWIPSRWWQRRIEEMQEQASDMMVHRFGISQLALAEAVLKAARKAKEMPSAFVFPFRGRYLCLAKRIQTILHKPNKPITGWRTIQYGFLICSLLSVLFGKLWVF